MKGTAVRPMPTRFLVRIGGSYRTLSDGEFGQIYINDGLHRKMLDDIILRYFGRHLVALCITTRYRDEPTRFNAYSGTLLKVDNDLLWLTAGHNIRHIEEALATSDVTIKQAVFADAFGPSPLSERPVPMDLRSSIKTFQDDDSLGLDFGAIVIHPHQSRLLLANGVIALEQENWIRQHSVDYMGFTLMGLPAELGSELLPDDGRAVVSPTMIMVNRLDDVPPGYETTYPRLSTRILDPIPLESVKGMSGGPIFGFAIHEGKLKYWIVAVQSAWLKTSRTLFGCPLPVLAPTLTDWVRTQRTTGL